MSTVAKVAGGTAALGGTGTVGYGAYDYSTYTLEYLIKEDSKFIEEGTTNKNSHLKALIRSYRSVTDLEKKFKNPDLNVGTGETEPSESEINALFSRCNELRKTWVRFGDFEELKAKVKNWCTEITDVRDGLSREGKVALKDSDEESAWKAIFSGNDQNGLKTFLVISDSLAADSHWSTLKTKCNESLGKIITDSNYSTSLSNARKYCVRSST